MNRIRSLALSGLALVSCALVAQALTVKPNVGPVVTSSMPNYDQYLDTTRVINLSAYFADPDSSSAARLTTPLGSITVTLDGEQAPATVTNFLNYITSGRYFKTDPTNGDRASTFFHRSLSNFVIQTGGFIGTVNSNGTGNVQPAAVATFPAVQNEPFISNTRGTIAMAKLAGDPNSATSQWFINLADNSANLDAQNGGFTVFGHVTGAGMNVADQIAALRIINAGSPFDTLPVRDYTSPNPVKVPNLVSIPEFLPASPLTYSATSDNPSVATVVASEGNLLVKTSQIGTANITVTGFDLDGAGPVSQTFTVHVITTPVHVANIATRGNVGSGDVDPLIGGFIVRGDGPKRVVVRALGPSLAGQGVANVLNNPTLELHDSTGAVIGSNDNWQEALNKQELIDLHLAPTEPNESAILTTLPSNSTGLGYTVVIHGVGSSGIALVEVYDLDSGPGSSVLNISTRSNVRTGDNVMIGGFIINGTGAQRVVVRAIGPSLSAAGIANPLADPTLTLFNSQGTQIDFNDNWPDHSSHAAVEAANLQPTNPYESAVLDTLAPGGYTAIVRGLDDTTGTALVEVYAVPPAMSGPQAAR